MYALVSVMEMMLGLAGPRGERNLGFLPVCEMAARRRVHSWAPCGSSHI